MSKHKLVRPRRVPVAPLVLTGALAASVAVTAAPYAGAAVSGSPASAAASLSAAAATTSAQAPSQAGPVSVRSLDGFAFDPRTPQRVLRGFSLRAKPPPWQLPVAGYHLTARFGMSSGLWAHGHTGLDFAAPQGTPIRAVAPGVVTAVGYDGAYGDKTEIRLDEGTVLWFCHQSGTEVRVGQRVSPGQLIGYVGSTGNVTGPHLHLEVHPHGGGPVDPEAWLPEHGLHP